jgi:hypothetical protein
MTAQPVMRSLSARGGLLRDAAQGGVTVLPDSTRPRLLLTDGDSLQLATLIANMVEDHLRAATSVERGTSLEQEVRNDREDYTSTLTEDGLCLCSPVEHGTSTASS